MPRVEADLADRGSRMHVLDWLEDDSFAEAISDMVSVTGMTMSREANRMPRNGRERAEARLGKQCGGLISDGLNLQLRDWWLAKHAGANVPNWDLACSTTSPDGRPGLVLMEAKAHVAEFIGEAKGKGPGNPDNRARIAGAIEEARHALSRQISGTEITIERWYQLANRVAFAWKLATSGVPTTLVYLGITGDAGVGRPIRNHDHWTQMISMTSKVLPNTIWETRIDCGAAPLWMLARSKACVRQTPLPAVEGSTSI